MSHGESDKSSLQQCPFCGGQAELSLKSCSVYCIECGAEGARYASDEGAVNGWNKRVAASYAGIITAEPITTQAQLESVYLQAIRGRHISEIAPVLALRNRALESFAPSHELPAAWIEFSKANGETSEGVMRRALGEIASMPAVSMLTAAPNEMERNALAAAQALAVPSAIAAPIPCRGCQGRERDLCLDKIRCARIEAL